MGNIIGLMNLGTSLYLLSKEKWDLRSEENHNLTVDKDSNTFEVSGFMNPTVKYKYKDGVLTANLGGTEQDYYKKGTQAYKDALKKFGQEERDWFIISPFYFVGYRRQI